MVLRYSWIGTKRVEFDSFGCNESIDILPTATEYAHSTYMEGRYSQPASSGWGIIPNPPACPLCSAGVKGGIICLTCSRIVLDIFPLLVLPFCALLVSGGGKIGGQVSIKVASWMNVIPDHNADDTLDIFADSLEVLFNYRPVAIASKITWTHESSGITLAVPRVAEAKNWNLHADAIWGSSVFVAENLDMFFGQGGLDGRRVLELGAGAGMAGISIARRWKNVRVVITDYPDLGILRTLQQNVASNFSEDDYLGNERADPRVQVRGHAWGSGEGICANHYHVVVAIDTLWTSETHVRLCQSIALALKRDEDCRVYLVAGIHTGRWVLDAFLKTVVRYGLCIDYLIELRVRDGHEREWYVGREETPEERHEWLLYIRLRWSQDSCVACS
jgi:nicotinamide N-methyltransferase